MYHYRGQNLTSAFIAMGKIIISGFVHGVLNTDNFNALQVWKKNLDLLEKTNLSTMNLSEINTISHKLSSALYLMLLNTT